MERKINKQRFSIRKYSIGTGSVLLGVLIFLGVNQEAQAAENDHATENVMTEESTTSEENPINNANNMTENTDTNTNEAENKESLQNDDKNTESESVNEATTEEIQPNSNQTSNTTEENMESNITQPNETANTDSNNERNENTDRMTATSAETDNQSIIQDISVKMLSPENGSTIDYNTNINLALNMTFNPNAKPGDKFEITLPDYMNKYSGSKMLNVYDKEGELLGNVNYENNKLIFTADNYFDTHTDINANLNIVTKATSPIWENNTSREVGLLINDNFVSTNNTLNLKVSTYSGYTESLTPVQEYKEGVSDILHMYSTPQFKESGRHTVEFISENYPDAYYNCEAIEKYGLNLHYGVAKNNYTLVNTIKDADKYNIKVVCSKGKVTVSMDVEQGYGYTVAVPVLLADNIKQQQSMDEFYFSNNSTAPEGTTWSGKKL